MSRTLPATVSTAIAKDATRPAYLLRLGFSAASPIGETLAATWGSNISWNGETWLASGIEVRNLNRAAATLEFPLGASDPWLALVTSAGVRGRSVQIYEHYTDTTQSPQTGAVLLFTGIMDDAVMSDSIVVRANEKSRATSFPPEVVGPPKFTYLLKPGDTIEWSGVTIVVR